DMCVAFNDETQIWRLARGPKDSKGIDGVVFMATGALIHIDLPPNVDEQNDRGMRNKIRFLNQSVTIAGMGSELFQDSIDTLKELHQRGEREFKQGQLEEWCPGQFQGDDAVEMVNWYFRPQTKSENQTSVQLSSDINPKGVLRWMAGDNMVHTEDNIMKYYKKVSKRQYSVNNIMTKSDQRYAEAKPQMFRTGDIVEVQCSIVFIKGKAGVVKMKLILRALALVNCKHSMVRDSYHARLGKLITPSPPTPARTPKRKGKGQRNEERTQG
ncbi:hypothetical protein ARMGADRAFT_933168, partial [Armillaria gallica]